MKLSFCSMFLVQLSKTIIRGFVALSALCFLVECPAFLPIMHRHGATSHACQPGSNPYSAKVYQAFTPQANTGPRSRCNKLCTTFSRDTDPLPSCQQRGNNNNKGEWMEILEDAGNATVKAALCKYVASNPEWFFGPKLGAVKDATKALA
jgi:hypothetical protein